MHDGHTMKSSTLHVFSEQVDAQVVLSNDYVLHFTANFIPTPLIKCRGTYDGVKESIPVRDDVISDYLALTTGIGLVERNAKTFKESLLVDENSASLWWYHMTSCRDNTQDSVFNDMLLLYTIDNVKKETDCENIIFHGFQSRIVKSILSKWSHSEFRNTKPGPSYFKLILKGLGSRLKYLILAGRKISITKNIKMSTKKNFDVLYFGFWDWSVKLDSDGHISDKYHKKLPTHVSEKYGLTQAWLVLFDPHSEPGSENRKMKDVISKSLNHEDVFFLQSYIFFVDLLKEFLRVKPLITYISYKNLIHGNLTSRGFDVSFLFKIQLLYRFLDSSILHLRLVELATKRACEVLQPATTVSFLETYPFSRACYAGVNQFNKLTSNIAIQHASRNRESMFFMSDISREGAFNHQPLGMPRANYFCAMGAHGAELALTSGYNPNNVVLTGSPRFDHVVRGSSSRAKNHDLCVIFAASGLVDIEVPAFLLALKAIKNIAGIQLVLREHFFWKVSHIQEVKNCLTNIEVSKLSLDDDLDRADLVLFTTTTLAEEALMRSIPVWQIVSTGSNFSSLSDVKEVDYYFNKNDLSKALVTFKEQASHELFNEYFLDQIERRCFYKCDGQAAERVAKFIYKLLKNDL